MDVWVVILTQKYNSSETRTAEVFVTQEMATKEAAKKCYHRSSQLPAQLAEVAQCLYINDNYEVLINMWNEYSGNNIDIVKSTFSVKGHPLE